MKHDADPSNHRVLPIVRHGRREAWIILGAWLVCLVWTIGYCYVAGYGAAGGEVATVMGFPAWVFWGIFAPWVVVTVFSIVFALYFMADDDLGEDAAVARGELTPDDAAGEPGR